MPDAKILFVCHGNICRSPMAEFVMRDMVEKAGLGETFEIASAATTNDEIGNDTYPGTKRMLDKHGIPYSRRHARHIRPDDYSHYDYIVGMDGENMRHMRRFFGSDPEAKLSLLLDWTGDDRDVADPWYTRDFEATYRDVVAGCEALLEHIEG